MLEENIKKVREQIRAVCLKQGIDAASITVLAATKTIAPDLINRLKSFGIDLIGENRVQEMQEKYALVRNLTWHFIGALQTNKVKYVIDKAEMIHSLDRVSLADEIDVQADKRGLNVKALVEINMGGEESKSGIEPERLEEFLDMCVQKKNLTVCGLMSVMPKNADERLYEKMNEMFLKHQTKVFNTLSVGMSGDYLTAIKHGANLVRLGSIIFGPRT